MVATLRLRRASVARKAATSAPDAGRHGAFALTMGLGVGMAGYGAGWQVGHVSALNASGALTGALRQADPDEEVALVTMVRANNLPDAWVQYRKSATIDKSG